MEKRIQVIDGHLVIAVVVVLTASEYNTLENKDKNIQKRVDAIAKDLAVKWAVEIGGNISTCAISREFGVIVGHQEMHDMELVADKFMKAIRDINLSDVHETECPSHEDDKVDYDEEELEFVKKLLNDLNLPLNDARHVCGALIIDTTTNSFCTELTSWGAMSHNLLKEMCQLYIKTHDHE